MRAAVNSIVGRKSNDYCEFWLFVDDFLNRWVFRHAFNPEIPELGKLNPGITELKMGPGVYDPGIRDPMIAIPRGN